MQAFETPGRWWLPDTPENEVAGILKYSDEAGLRLDLLGVLVDFTVVRIGSGESLPIILGLTHDGAITLQDCQLLPGKITLGFFATQTVTAKVAYCSYKAHFTTPDDLRFTAADVGFTYLPYWVHLSGTSIRIIEEKDTGTRSREIHNSDPLPLTVTTPWGTITLNIRAHEPYPGRVVAIRENVWLSIVTSDPQPLDWWMTTIIGPLQDFLTLATGHPNEITRLDVYSPAVQEEGPMGMSPVRVTFRGRYSAPPSSQLRTLDEDEMLFALRGVEDRFDSLMNRWLEISDQYKEVCNRYFGTEYRDYVYPADAFNNLVQAIEGWHRVSAGSEPTEKDIARLEAILESVPGEYRKWVQWNLKYSHEPRLPDRLNAALDIADELIRPVIESRATFVSSIVKMRNDLAHAKSDSQHPHPLMIYRRNEQLAILIQLLYLHELGLPPALARKTTRYLLALSRTRSADTPPHPDDGDYNPGCP